MRPKADIEQMIARHGNTVWRVCVLYFGQGADAQDAFQDTMLKYSLSNTRFNEEEHRKAWLIRVATNRCKDMLKAAHRKNVSLDDGSLCAETLANTIADKSNEEPGSALSEALEAIRALPDPPRTPVYLALYEGYTAPEISDLLNAPVNTVYSWISRGRQLLKEVLR